MASETGVVSKRIAQSARVLEKMKPHELFVVLGSGIAILAGIATYAVYALTTAASPLTAIYLIVFGLLGLAAYGVMRKSLRNGAIVAGISGLALLFVAGGAAGILMGLLVLVGAAWGLVKSL